MVQNGDKDSLFSRRQSIQCRGKLVSLASPVVMGILNISPGSFYDGGFYRTPSDWVRQTARMLEEGATFIDLGAVSTRPGAKDILEEKELALLIPALKHLVQAFPDALFSVDTWRAKVARHAIETGASMVNDVSGGRFDPGMLPWIASAQVPYIMMHSLDKPANMQDNPYYEDVLAEVLAFFARQTSLIVAEGAKDILIDPGFGFGKTLAHNYRLLAGLPTLSALGYPVLVGISRKSMLCKPLGISPVDALNASTAAHVLALLGGARILRVHDVKEAVQAIQIWNYWQGARS